MAQSQIAHVTKPATSTDVADNSFFGVMLDFLSCGGTTEEIVVPSNTTIDKNSADELMNTLAFLENYLSQDTSSEFREPADNITLFSPMNEGREQEKEPNVLDIVKGFFGFSEETQKPMNNTARSSDRSLTRDDLLHIIRQLKLRASKREDFQDVSESEAVKETCTFDDVMHYVAFPEKLFQSEKERKEREASVQHVDQEASFGSIMNHPSKYNVNRGKGQILQTSEERDLLDDVFEGRIIPCGVPENVVMKNDEQQKLSVHEKKDLEGRLSSKGFKVHRLNPTQNPGLQQEIIEKKGKKLVTSPPLVSDSQVTPRVEQVRDDATDRDLLKVFFENFLCSYQTKSEVDCPKSLPQPKEIQTKVEGRDLLDDVVEDRLSSSRTAGTQVGRASKLSTEKDALDQVFESVERQLCGANLYNIEKGLHQGRCHRSLIDDASTLSSTSCVSRKSLGIFSHMEHMTAGQQNKQERGTKEKNIIQSFFSRNGK